MPARRQQRPRAATRHDPAIRAAACLRMQQYACTTCHVIPGMVGARAYVGPPLTGIARRKYLAGTLPNSPENMVRWIRDPKSVSPDDADAGSGRERGTCARHRGVSAYTLK